MLLKTELSLAIYLSFHITPNYLLFRHLRTEFQQQKHYEKMSNIFKAKGAAMKIEKLLMNDYFTCLK